ncbi:MAG: hypothetical protein NDI82_13595 [Anaeromyxobacteraceae bacterium]|nr:hypothetical protein [Anaeromyxobacteraceae bacterium]
MRFLVDPGSGRLARARAPVRAFLAFAALALLASLLQRASGGGLSAAEVELHYLGAEAGEGLPRAALWEELHAGAFLYGFLLFMVGALLPTCRLQRATGRALFAAAVAAALADLAAPFLVTFLGGAGAVRVATTLLAAAALLAAVGTILATFGPAGPARLERAGG